MAMSVVRFRARAEDLAWLEERGIDPSEFAKAAFDQTELVQAIRRKRHDAG